jgi:lipopolysaccharide transport system ATP-binding protein
MSDIVIKAENLGKKYTIGHRSGSGSSYLSLRDVLTQNARDIWHKTRDLVQGKDIVQGSILEEFWALKEVNFEIQRGEAVGIIGRNGAGKSTLLKVLSRITEPSAGRVTIKGRVASLLEVGTGFHPELTGRENIYLNGAILGMTRAEIKRKFDEIVAFAETEKFLDTPVKRYSSGMYVRLAFAVAAHLEPEILVVDEVLAVGDAQFQKKCLGKMGDVAHEGRTVLFVSHNMAAIHQLCTSGILLVDGRLTKRGTAGKVIRCYLDNTDEQQSSVTLREYKFRTGNGKVTFLRAELRNAENALCRQFSLGDDLCVIFWLKARHDFKESHIKLGIEIRTSDGRRICNIMDVDSGFHIDDFNSNGTVSVYFRDLRLYPDTYYMNLKVHSITSNELYDLVEDCLSFEIIDGGKLAMRSLPKETGLLFLTPEWRKMHIDNADQTYNRSQDDGNL